MLNTGRGGEEAIEELLRFDRDIFAEQPSLVIWQVGTNAVFHKERYDLDEVAAAIAAGLARLRGQPIDVLLMDPHTLRQCSSTTRLNFLRAWCR